MIVASALQQAHSQDKRDDIAAKVRQYAEYPLKYDIENLSEQERELVAIFIQIADIMDEIYWEQSFGLENKNKLWRMGSHGRQQTIPPQLQKQTRRRQFLPCRHDKKRIWKSEKSAENKPLHNSASRY